MMLRRRILKDQAAVTYINLTADVDGYIPKTAVPFNKGAHVKITWDTTDLSNFTGTILSMYQQINSFNDVNPIPSAGGGYPILSQQFHSDIVQGGSLEITVSQDNLIGYVSCWNASEYSDPSATSRRAKIAFINFEIEEG